MSTHSSHAAVTSTVAGLSDDQLLEQTVKLASLDHQIHVFVIDHLCEIEARRAYLDRGFSGLFDYVKRGLGYTDAATWRRIGAMKLCARLDGVRERLWDGSLTLDAAAQLQAAFERRERERSRQARGTVAGSALRPDGSARSVPAPSAQGNPAPKPSPGPVLDLSAQQALVDQAVGKSTREVAKMLADVDPALAVPADRVRPLGEGRWELKAVIDAECQRGLEQLRGLLSHIDPRMTLGQLVERLVREGLDRHDPARPQRRGRARSAAAGADRPPATQPNASSDRAAASEPKRSATHAEVRATAAKTQPASSCCGVPSPAQRPAQIAGADSMPANRRLNADRRTTSAPKRTDRTGAKAVRSAPHRRFGAEDATKLGRSSAVRRKRTARATDLHSSAPKEGARGAGPFRRRSVERSGNATGDAAATSIHAADADARHGICWRSTTCSRTPWAAAPSRTICDPCAAHHRDRHAEPTSRRGPPM